MIEDYGDGIDNPYGRDPATRSKAAMYMIRTGRGWALEMLGVSDAELPEKYILARDKLLAAEPAPPVDPSRLRYRDKARDYSRDSRRSKDPEPEPAAPPDTPETPVQAADLGGVIRVQGPRRTVTRVHVGPAPGVCSVEDDGCGYCLGVPCKSPRQQDVNTRP